MIFSQGGVKACFSQEVTELWNKFSQDNFKECADLDGYWEDFYALFGFGIDGVDYEADVEV